MYYIIFDLEWNSAYNYAAQNFMNEIIEIGAVKLDQKLNVVDTYKQLVIPHYTRKLSSRCKRLTNITNEEIKANGVPFKEAFDNFAQWGRGDGNVYMSWSNSDLFVLSANFLQNFGSARVEFIKNYCDVQKYCMSFLSKEDNPGGNQVALERCAELFKIEVDTETLHRALADCYVTAQCFKKVFDEKKLRGYIKPCDGSFFEQLLFKPYYITDEVTDTFNIDDTDIICPHCGGLMDVPEELSLQNKAFKGATCCNYCMKTYWVFIRAKQLYDRVNVKVSYVEMNRKRAKKFLADRKKSRQK